MFQPSRPPYFLLLILLALGCGQTNAPDAPAVEKDIIPEAFTGIHELMGSGDILGLSIAIVGKDQPVRTFATGRRHVEEGGRVDDGTIFEAASLSKPVFARAILQLAERNVLDLDTPLATYLPYERLEHDERYLKLTARHVLSHQSGLPNWGGTPLKMVGEPGAAFGYSGEGYVYLQKVAEKLTGQSLNEIVTTEVFEPLGMNESSFVWQEAFADRMATGHTRLGKPLYKDRGKEDEGNAAASLLTTARDFAKFLTAMMEDDFQNMLAAQVQVTDEDSGDPVEGVSWGLGWGVQEGGSGIAFFHWGDNTGYKAYTLGYPENGFALVYFANSDNGLSIVGDAIAQFAEGEHPAVAWIDYERHDAPERQVRHALEKAFFNESAEAGLQRFQELKPQHPDLDYETMLNRLGYALLRNDSLDEGIAVFNLNSETYPDSWNVFDSLGEAYATGGMADAAITSYSRSLELNPENENATKAIAYLKEGVELRGNAPTLSPETLQRYVGNYGQIQVTFEDGDLHAQIAGFNKAFKLVALTESSFDLERLGRYRLHFHNGDDGEVARVVAQHVGGHEINAARRP